MQYQLIVDSDTVKMIEDDETVRYIPSDPRNRDWQEYQTWLALGNTPEPAEE